MSGRHAPRLGRGLASLIPESERAEADPTSRIIAVDALEPNPYQARGPISPESVAELVASVREHGVLQPLLVRVHPEDGTRYQIIAGERRWRAAQAAGLRELPVLVRPLSDRDALAAGLVENLQRTDLNAIEEAEGYRRLLAEFGLTQEALAHAVGKSRSHVGNILRLLGLPDAVKHEVRNGRLSSGHARALLTHPDPADAANTAIAQGLSVRQTEAMVTAAHGRQGPTAAQAPRDPDLVFQERDLSAHLGLRVRMDWNGRSGHLRVDVETLDQLDGVMRLLRGSG